MSAAPIAVIGAGAAGLLAALELATRGVAVDVYGPAGRGPVASAGRWLAAAPLDGAAVDRAEEDAHVADAVAASGGTADAAVLRALVRAAPALADALIRRGVPFHRREDGRVAREGGAGHHAARLIHADAATGFHVVHALDRALDHAIAGGAPAHRRAGWEVVAIATDEAGAAVGVVAQDLRTMEIRARPASAVIVASGGFAGAWAGSSARLDAVGTGIAAAVRAGAVLADPDRIDVHPIAVPRPDKPVPLPDVLRALGGRVWVPSDPADRRRPRDIPTGERVVVLDGGSAAVGRADAARALVGALAAGRGVPGASGAPPHAWLDVTHLGTRALAARLGRLAVEVERVTGLALGEAPVPVVPVVHATLGGLQVAIDLDPSGDPRADSPGHFATSVPGLFAVGGAVASPSGAARLTGHRLLAGLFGARLAAGAAAVWATSGGVRAADAAEALLARRAGDEVVAYDRLVARAEGAGETAEEVLRALGEALDTHAGLSPSAPRDLGDTLDALGSRAGRARCSDGAPRVNRGAPAIRRLDAALLLARAVAASAQARAAGAASVAVRLVNGQLVATGRDPAADAVEAR